jgi:hypothetical protein
MLTIPAFFAAFDYKKGASCIILLLEPYASSTAKAMQGEIHGKKKIP